MSRLLDKFGFLTEISSSRDFPGTAGKAISIFAVAIALYHLYTFTLGLYDPYVHCNIHVGSILALCFLTYSFSSKRLGKWYINFFLALLSLGIMVYYLLNSERLLWGRAALAAGSLTPWDIILGVALIPMLFEAARRAIGLFFPLLVATFIIYANIGPYLGGFLHHPGFTFIQIVDFLNFSFEGIFAIPIRVCSSYIILFIIFAALIQVTPVGNFFINLAQGLAGKSRGGPAKIAVIASGFIGSISGSAPANVATTGAITIPMMKKMGYQPHIAGAIEAAASKGGHIMPPVMAGTVFIMCEFVGVPYFDVIVAAAIPAILYFLCILIQVHFHSVKHGIRGLPKEQVPRVREVLKTGWHYFVPFIVLVGLLAYGFTAMRAVLFSMPVVLVVSYFRKESRIGIKELFKALDNAMRMQRLITLATALAGMIMGIVLFTGLASKISVMIEGYMGGIAIIPLFLTASVCFILGMGVSIPAAYIITAVLILPATVSLGFYPLAAHLFAIYWASVATISPPVGATFYLAASMAGAKPFQTGWYAVRFAAAAFIIPFAFVLNPALLLFGSPLEVIGSIIFTLVGIFSLAVAIEGWWLRRLSVPERLLSTLAAFLFISPQLVSIIAGSGIMASVLLWQWRGKRRQKGAF